MKSITSFLDFTLTLHQSSIWKPYYEIRFGDELLGSIKMSRFWNSRSEAVSADGVWSFTRQGLLRPKKITVSTQHGDIVATYQPSFFKRSGIMTIGKEETYTVKMGFFRNTLDVYSNFDEQIIHVRNRWGIRLRSEITFSHTVKRIQQFPLIVFLSCYILLTAHRDARRSPAV